MFPALVFGKTFLVGIATLHPFASVTCIATTIVDAARRYHSTQWNSDRLVVSCRAVVKRVIVA